METFVFQAKVDGRCTVRLFTYSGLAAAEASVIVTSSQTAVVTVDLSRFATGLYYVQGVIESTTGSRSTKSFPLLVR